MDRTMDSNMNRNMDSTMDSTNNMRIRGTFRPRMRLLPRPSFSPTSSTFLWQEEDNARSSCDRQDRSDSNPQPHLNVFMMTHSSTTDLIHSRRNRKRALPLKFVSLRNEDNDDTYIDQTLDGEDERCCLSRNRIAFTSTPTSTPTSPPCIPRIRPRNVPFLKDWKDDEDDASDSISNDSLEESGFMDICLSQLHLKTEQQDECHPDRNQGVSVHNEEEEEEKEVVPKFGTSHSVFNHCTSNSIQRRITEGELLSPVPKRSSVTGDVFTTPAKICLSNNDETAVQNFPLVLFGSTRFSAFDTVSMK